MDEDVIRLAMSRTYDAPILVDPADWRMPKGALAENAGPC